MAKFGINDILNAKTKAAGQAEQYEKMRKSVEYQLRTGSVVMLPAYLHVEAIIKQRGGRNIEIKQENGVVNV